MPNTILRPTGVTWSGGTYWVRSSGTNTLALISDGSDSTYLTSQWYDAWVNAKKVYQAPAGHIPLGVTASAKAKKSSGQSNGSISVGINGSIHDQKFFGNTSAATIVVGPTADLENGTELSAIVTDHTGGVVYDIWFNAITLANPVVAWLQTAFTNPNVAIVAQLTLNNDTGYPLEAWITSTGLGRSQTVQIPVDATSVEIPFPERVMSPSSSLQATDIKLIINGQTVYLTGQMAIDDQTFTTSAFTAPPAPNVTAGTDTSTYSGNVVVSSSTAAGITNTFVVLERSDDGGATWVEVEAKTWAANVGFVDIEKPLTAVKYRAHVVAVDDTTSTKVISPNSATVSVAAVTVGKQLIKAAGILLDNAFFTAFEGGKGDSDLTVSWPIGAHQPVIRETVKRTTSGSFAARVTGADKAMAIALRDYYGYVYIVTPAKELVRCVLMPGAQVSRNNTLDEIYTFSASYQEA